MSDDELAIYNSFKSELNNLEIQIQKLDNDLSQIEVLKSKEIIKGSFEFDSISISEKYKDKVSLEFRALSTEYRAAWKLKLQTVSSNITADKIIIEKRIEGLKNESIFKSGELVFNHNAQYSLLDSKLMIQKEKLFQITSLISEIGNIERQIKVSKTDIITLHDNYYTKLLDIKGYLDTFHDGVAIKAKPLFQNTNYKNFLYSSINQQSSQGQSLANFDYVDHSAYMDRLRNLLEMLHLDNVTLKNGFNPASLIQQLLSTNFYDISYDLEYDNDSFHLMSEGKKAFVVLKLLLDFSGKDCPILIDQPEDDLDNRAIYKDLVVYLKRKKKERQILVATHNPNIVVGADTEQVIVANQHGKDTSNLENKKFQYVTGSLECSKRKQKSSTSILECQGIREHVCEILEGGDEAFLHRENKYGLKRKL